MRRALLFNTYTYIDEGCRPIVTYGLSVSVNGCHNLIIHSAEERFIILSHNSFNSSYNGASSFMANILGNTKVLLDQTEMQLTDE